jgi:hypothetical protein
MTRGAPKLVPMAVLGVDNPPMEARLLDSRLAICGVLVGVFAALQSVDAGVV